MSRLLSKLLNKNFCLDKDLVLQVSQWGGGRFQSGITAKLQKIGPYEN